MHRSFRMPILVGLPGVGKTTTSRILAERLGIGHVQTDELFREYRGLLLRDENPAVEILRRFLERDDIASIRDALKKDMVIPDPKGTGQTKLASSSYFISTYSESVFRAFEIEMLRWLEKNGIFRDSIPDLSASAPLYPENQSLFANQNCYCKVLLNMSDDVLIDRLTVDYERFKARGKSIRGRYERQIDGSLQQARANTGQMGQEERTSVIKATLQDLLTEDRAHRWEDYLHFAKHMVTVEADWAPEDVSAAIRALL